MKMKPSSRSETAPSTRVGLCTLPHLPAHCTLPCTRAPGPHTADWGSFSLSEAVSSRLQSSNIFTVAKRNVEGQDMLYQSLKLTNGIWVLAELRIQPGNPSFTVRVPAPALPAPGCLPPSSGQPFLPSLLPRLGVSSDGVRSSPARLGPLGTWHE